MAETALDIITSAMRKAGILTKTESPSADEAQDGLEMLNDLLESNSNDGLMVYARTLESFPLSGGVSDYTIGVGGDFNTIRPVNIVRAYIRIGEIDYPVRVVRDEDYADIILKDINSIPYYVNFTNGFPLATLKFYPVPSSSWTLYLLTEKQLDTFTLNEEIILPLGWKRYLKNTLAVELAPEYGVQVPQETVLIASLALAAIKRGAARAKTMDNPTNNYGKRNVFTGWEY
jgi:hypothetical protein